MVSIGWWGRLAIWRITHCKKNASGLGLQKLKFPGILVFEAPTLLPVPIL